MRLSTRINGLDDVRVEEDGKFWVVSVLGTTNRGFVGETKFLFKEKKLACFFADILRSGKDE